MNEQRPHGEAHGTDATDITERRAKFRTGHVIRLIRRHNARQLLTYEPTQLEELLKLESKDAKGDLLKELCRILLTLSPAQLTLVRSRV